MLKKLSLLAATLCLTQTSNAATLYVDFQCSPTIGSLPYVLINNGVTISGLAKEYINGKRVSDPLFSGVTPPGVPPILSNGGYHRSSVNYNPLKGIVSCNYQSAGSNSPFSVSYLLDNGVAGEVVYSTPSSIRIRVEIGLR